MIRYSSCASGLVFRDVDHPGPRSTRWCRVIDYPLPCAGGCARLMGAQSMRLGQCIPAASSGTAVGGAQYSAGAGGDGTASGAGGDYIADGLPENSLLLVKAAKRLKRHDKM